MTEKPEWFELAGEDSPQSPKPKKRLVKVALIAAPLVLIGGAFVAAQGEGGDDAPSASVGSLSGGTVVSQGSAQNESLAPTNSNAMTTPTITAKVPSNTKTNFANPNSENPGSAANDPDHGAGLDRPKRFGEHPKDGIHREHEGEHAQSSDD